MGHKATIEGIAYYLPEQRVTSEEVERRVYDTTQFRIPKGLIERLTGTASRCYREDGTQASDLAVNAAKLALDQSSMDANDIDLLIFASCAQDITEPATANILQEKLEARNAQVFDVKNACNSFLNGIDIAESHIRAGKARTALVAVGETLSLGINWNIQSIEELRTNMAALTLGDAGAAAVLRGDPDANGRGILTSHFESYGDHWRWATLLAGGSMHQLSPEHAYFSGNSRKLRDAAVEYIPAAVKRLLDRVGWKPEEVDVVCSHQVTEVLILDIAERTGIPSHRCIFAIRDCGNTAAASIPICLSRAQKEGRLKPGSKVLLVGGAAGFSVGVIALVW